MKPTPQHTIEPDVVLPFRDRREAGRRLAVRLHRYDEHHRAVVLGLPRGGVVPAAEIASALRLPLDVVISRKLGAPGNPELAIGAIAEGGTPFLNPEAVALIGASKSRLAEEIEGHFPARSAETARHNEVRMRVRRGRRRRCRF